MVNLKRIQKNPIFYKIKHHFKDIRINVVVLDLNTDYRWLQNLLKRR